MKDVRERVVVIGKTGSGKSTWTKALVAELVRAGWRVVVFDPCDEYSSTGRGGRYVSPGPLPQRATMRELLARPELLDAPGLALAVVPSRDSVKLCAKDFAALAQLCRHTGGLVLVVEEVGFIADAAAEQLKALATLYRHEGIAAVFVAQRATQIPLTARSQASTVVAFRQDEPPDLEALREKCGPAMAEAAARCGVGECAIWRDSI